MKMIHGTAAILVLAIQHPRHQLGRQEEGLEVLTTAVDPEEEASKKDGMEVEVEYTKVVEAETVDRRKTGNRWRNLHLDSAYLVRCLCPGQFVIRLYSRSLVADLSLLFANDVFAAQSNLDGSSWMKQRQQKMQKQEEENRREQEQRLKREQEEKRERRKNQFGALKVSRILGEL